jgi:hypothetical protein
VLLCISRTLRLLFSFRMPATLRFWVVPFSDFRPTFWVTPFSDFRPTFWVAPFSDIRSTFWVPPFSDFRPTFWVAPFSDFRPTFGIPTLNLSRVLPYIHYPIRHLTSVLPRRHNRLIKHCYITHQHRTYECV